MLSKSRIRDLAVQLRAAIEATPPLGLPFGLCEFPKGSCGDASVMLVKLMAVKGATSAAYMNGHRRVPEYMSHAWAFIDGYFVDITGDQFGRPPVVVTSFDPWFEQWENAQSIALGAPRFDSFAESSLVGFERLLAGIR